MTVKGAQLPCQYMFIVCTSLLLKKAGIIPGGTTGTFFYQKCLQIYNSSMLYCQMNFLGKKSDRRTFNLELIITYGYSHLKIFLTADRKKCNTKLIYHLKSS